MKFYAMLLVSFVILSCSTQTDPMVKNVDVTEFKSLMANENTVVLDVRTPDEIANGKIANAAELDFFADGFDAKVAQLDKSKTYLVYCKSGGRSGKTCNKMAAQGFKNVYNLKGGYKAWSKGE